MSFNSAQEFVAAMRGDAALRTMVTGFEDRRKLKDYLQTRGYEFDLPDLIKAMAACMAGREPGSQ